VKVTGTITVNFVSQPILVRRIATKKLIFTPRVSSCFDGEHCLFIWLLLLLLLLFLFVWLFVWLFLKAERVEMRKNVDNVRDCDLTECFHRLVAAAAVVVVVFVHFSDVLFIR
jgi:hypothetical protein